MSKLKVIPRPKRKIFYKLLRDCYNAPYIEWKDIEVRERKLTITMNNGVGFCWKKSLGKDSLYLNPFPELAKFRPEGAEDNDLWFPYDEKGYLKRQEIINQVCKDLNI